MDSRLLHVSLNLYESSVPKSVFEKSHAGATRLSIRRIAARSIIVSPGLHPILVVLAGVGGFSQPGKATFHASGLFPWAALLRPGVVRARRKTPFYRHQRR